MKLVAIAPDAFDAQRASAAGGRRAAAAGCAGLVVDADGYAYELEAGAAAAGRYAARWWSYAVRARAWRWRSDAEQQEDGGFFFAALWVLVG